ncbi:hypothetical protein ACFPRL_10855 [Pseudoclavibacter helvolus]
MTRSLCPELVRLVRAKLSSDHHSAPPVRAILCVRAPQCGHFPSLKAL